MISTTRRVALIIFILSLIPQAKGQSYTQEDFKRDWTSPFQVETSKNILWWGTGLTALLVANRENFVDPLQEDIARDEPLGELSKYGDLAGQLVPNLLYMSYQYWQDTPVAKARAKLMFKASFFAGMTTFFLKRIINQRRPEGDDRNSHPSGHTTTAFAFASVVANEHPAWAIPAYSLASFVGLSRMNDNAHYLHDVVMGATIGMAYGYALFEKQKDEVVYLISPYHDGILAGIQFPF